MTRYRLQNLQIKRVATVDDPDNEPARIVLFKRRQDNVEGDEGMELQKLNLPEETQAAIQEELDALEKARDEAAKATDEAKAEIEKLKAEVAELKKEPEPDPIEKASPEVKAEFEALKKQREADAEELKKTRDELAKLGDEKRMEKAREQVNEWKNLPGVTQDDFAPVLKRVREKLDKEDADQIEKALKAANSAIGESDLLKETGRDGQGGEVAQRVEKMARERLQANPEKGYEQHYDDILKEQPELYNQMRSEADAGRAE